MLRYYIILLKTRVKIEKLKLCNQHAHFFRLEDLFEWVIYDRLVEKYGKDSVRMKSIYHYTIANKKRKSEPDFVVTDGNNIIVIDAKWKILESIIKISFDDVAKLWRDTLLEKATKSILIYPQIAFEERNISLTLN